MSDGSPFEDINNGDEVPNTPPPSYDYDNRLLRDFKQSVAIQEITNPQVPEIFNQDRANQYSYQYPKRYR